MQSRFLTGDTNMTNIIEIDLDDGYQNNLATFEKAVLENVMAQVKYNQSKAAKKLGLSRGTLRVKLKEHFGNLYFRDEE